MFEPRTISLTGPSPQCSTEAIPLEPSTLEFITEHAALTGPRKGEARLRSIVARRNDLRQRIQEEELSDLDFWSPGVTAILETFKQPDEGWLYWFVKELHALYHDQIIGRLRGPQSLLQPEDAASEAFERALRSGEDFLEHEAPVRWLFTVARNVGIDGARKRQRRNAARTPLREHKEVYHSAERADDATFVSAAAMAIESLSPELRNVALLMLEERTLEEISDHLEISIATASRRRRQVRKLLHARLFGGSSPTQKAS